jgi:hypothetical protein
MLRTDGVGRVVLLMLLDDGVHPTQPHILKPLPDPTPLRLSHTANGTTFRACPVCPRFGHWEQQAGML